MSRRAPAEPAVNPARGIVLVVIAVLVGLVLLRNGLDTSEAVTSTGSGSDESSDSAGDDGSATDDVEETTTTTLATGRPVAEVPIVVLNGSGTTGAAKAYTTYLTSLGYPTPNPDGANAENPASTATTLVFFTEGFEIEAAAVAAAVGVPDVVPTLLPAAAVPGPVDGASVVVVLGADIGGTPPPTGTGTADAGATDSTSTTV